MRTHGPGFDEPIVEYVGAGTGDRRWLVTDQLGSVVAATNASGASIATNTYDEYGRPGASNSGRFQYTGQMWIAEAGLYHYKARACEPVLGRFLQSDPILYAGGMNVYAYVSNDPMNLVDPFGLQSLFPNGGGPIITAPDDDPLPPIVIPAPAPCPQGWSCGPPCPTDENCFDDPFGGPAFGTRGANTLPRSYGEPQERPTLGPIDPGPEPPPPDMPQCPNVPGLGVTQSSNISGGAGFAVSANSSSQGSQYFGGYGVGLSARVDIGVGGDLFEPYQSPGYRGGPGLVAQTQVGALLGVTVTGLYTPHGNKTTIEWGFPIVGLSALAGGGVDLPASQPPGC